MAAPDEAANRPVSDPAPHSLRRVRRYTWWALVPFAPLAGAVTLVWLVLWQRPWPVTGVLALLTVAASAATGYLLHQALRLEEFTLAGVGRRGRAAGLVAVLAVTSAVGLATATGGVVAEWSVLVTVVAGVVVILAPPGRRLWWILAAGGGLTGAALLAGAGAVVAVAAGAVTALGAWGVWLTWWYYAAARALDRSRGQAAELAVAHERLRFAAELHDIQGQHLQVIALTSELAARLAGTDPQAAAGHMREVQRLAREALTETRSLVSGYRRVSLGTEIANATRVLAAADIDARPRLALPPAGRLGPAERLLGLVVREATTNILRHAAAGWARIELDRAGAQARLVVTNDGAGAGGPDPDHPAGQGLPALAERLAAVGGQLRWQRRGEEFTVTATAPLAPAEEPA